MNVSITFRHLEASESIKTYISDKVTKLQRLLRQPLTVKATLSLEKHEHVAEIKISSGSEHHEAKESSSDMYVSIDKVLAKLERQISDTHGAINSKRRRGGETLRGGLPLGDDSAD